MSSEAESVSLRNSIVPDRIGWDCDGEHTTPSLNNIVRGGSCLEATGISADPMLGDWVEATETTTGYFPLLEGSPAIDAAAESACSETDQLGNARPHGMFCDIGAIEFQGEPEPASDDAPDADFLVSSYNELADAIENAIDGDTIRLTGDITMSDHPPHIDKRITVEGAGHTISGNGQYRIFFVADSGDLTINNLTLRNGSAQDGGRECVAGTYWRKTNGGAICNHGSLTITNSSFSYNSAQSRGGAISNGGEASISISDSSFSGNSAGVGGAIFSHGEASLSITGSSFSDNLARSSGGAIDNNGEASISGSSFSGNFAGDDGGAIDNEGEASISDSSFSGNSADYSGGAIVNGREASLSISGSSFSGNSADERGGAIYAPVGSATIRNTTITGNSAGTGGGIRVGSNDEWTGTLTLRDSIIADNSGVDCSIERHSTLESSQDNYIKDGSCDATWSGSDARQRDGYCPASQLRDGVCQIGAAA